MVQDSSGSSDHDRQVNEIISTYLEAVDAGQTPDREEWLRRYPEFAAELEAFLADYEHVDRIAQPLRPATAMVTPLPPPRVASGDAETLDSTQPVRVSVGSTVRYLGDYELLAEIARGGMGVVYRARQVSLNRVVAVKMILAGHLATKADHERFHSEAQAAALLDHPNILPVFEVGEFEGQHYFSMGYVDGQSLAVRLAEEPMPPKEAAELVAKVAEAVEYAHRQGVIHRDIKPSNILIDHKGQPRVTDFGLAKRLDSGSELTTAGQILGTPSYMAPEQAAGQIQAVGPAADVYALGALLYATLTGRPPFQAATPVETLQQVLERAVALRQLNAAVPRDLEIIVLKCLEKPIPRRYATAQALAEDLRRYLDGRPILARPVGRWEHAWRWCRRQPVVAGLIAAVVATLLAGIAASTHFAVRAAQFATEAEQRAKDAMNEKTKAMNEKAIATKETERAEASTYDARLKEVQALRLGRPPGWSKTCFESLRTNAQMQIPGRDEEPLRTAGIACMLDLDVEEVARLKGHGSPIWSLDFSTDGSLLASAEAKGRILIWDVRRRQLTREIDGTAAEASGPGSEWFPRPPVRFHPLGNHLAYATLRQSVEWLPLTESAKPFPHLTSSSAPCCIDFDRTGQVIAVRWDGGRAGVYDVATGRPIREFGSLSRSIEERTVALHPDGSRLAVVGSDGTIYLYVVSGDDAPPKPLGSHRAEVTSLRFRPDGNRLLSTSNDRTARLFDLTGAGDPIALLGHSARVKASAFSPDGRLAATGGDDHTVRIWDADSGQCLMVLRHEHNEMLSVAFSPDGGYLAAGTGGGYVTGGTGSGSPDVILYRITNHRARQILGGHGYLVSGLAFHPNGRTLFSTSADKSVIKWNLLSGSVDSRWTPNEKYFAGTCTLSPDGSLLATSVRAFTAQSAAVYEVYVWDAATNEKRKTFSLHKAQVSALEFDPSGKYLATGDDAGACFVWDLSREKPLARPVTEKNQVKALAFLHGASQLLTAYADGQIEVSECASGLVTAKYRLPRGRRITSGAISPDQKHFVAGMAGGHIAVIAATDLAPLAQIDGAHDRDVSSLAFSSDGLWLASGGQDGKVIIWDSAARRKLVVFPAQDTAISTLAFEPHGSRLAAAGGATQITVWDLGAMRQKLGTIGLDWEARRPLDGGQVDRALESASVSQLQQRIMDPLHRADRPVLDPTLRDDADRADLCRVARRILAMEKDATSAASRAATFVLLADRGDRIVAADHDERAQLIAEIKAYLLAGNKEGITLQDINMAMRIAGALESKNPVASALAYREFAQVLHQGRDKQCAAAAQFMAGAARRLALVGTPLELQGTKLDGTPLDWQAYRGKVVLVQFWTSASRDFPALLAHTRQTYELYRDRGFDVLGINLDLDRGQLGQFVAADEVPWTVLPDESSGANSMAIRYGIASIAMTILVGKDGKVAAMDTEGQGLDKHLRELLGPAAAGPLTCIDLRSKGNWKLDETVPGFAENNLDPLPRGKQDFAGLTFQVGAAAMRLAGQLLQSEPIAIEAIPVNATAADLFFLHATQWGALPPDQVAEGTPIGEFTVHYDDGSVVSIPILYGRDVRDWVDHDHGRPTAQSTVVWRGMNRSTARNNQEIRLYLSVWRNPHPAKKIASLDYASTMTKAAPFCVAITAEGPSSSTPGNEVALGTGTTEQAPKNNSVPGPADPEPTRTKGFRVALEQLDKAIQEHPDDLSALQARLNINAVAANWREVEADLRSVIALAPTDRSACFRLAIVLAYLDDDAGYRKACTEFIDRFAGDPSEVTREQIGKVCLLRPSSLADMSRAYRIVETLRGGSYSADFRQWRSLALGLCAYRRGEYQQATAILEQAMREEGGMGGDNKLGMACMILAMAHQRSGGHAEAVAALEQGLAIVARKSKQPNTGRTLLDWHDWLTFLTLAREARGLVDPARKPAGAAEGK